MDESVPFTGEPPALDLVNTRPMSPRGRVDLIDTPDRLAAWLVLESGRLPAEVTALVPQAPDLPPVHAVREHAEAALRALWAGQAPPGTALRGLERAERAAPPVRDLGWDGERVTVTARRTGPVGRRLAAALAHEAVALLTDPAVGRLRECEADTCRMLFLPAHPRRRWCSPTLCGNRARAARHYRRHKAADGTVD
ncbi:CGNR zinc finger domain-containing protein [Streptomyces sp. BI20]|uniref:CGNR zinc finger domain-containing protein n=1 Tax=Streptomyces sp. BI20 TaxID=3403460 RepID=UPI003C76FF80